MSTEPYSEVSTRSTSQSQPIPGSNQVRNSAGGFSFEISLWDRVQRFLILGSDGGSYYVGQKTLTVDNAKAVMEAAETDGSRLVGMIVDVSDSGRAPKNDPALFALAIAASAKNPATRAAALDALPKVARIPTHLFHFATYAQNFRGWGRGLRRAVARWYEDRKGETLAYQVTKYAQRDGWSNRDLLRKAHPAATSSAHTAVYDFIMGRATPTQISSVPQLEGVDAISRASSATEAADLIHRYGLPWEVVPDQFRVAEVWQAILDDGMPLGAMIRQLPTLTRLGLLSNANANTKLVTSTLTNRDQLSAARIHPLAVLSAMLVYRGGRGVQGSSTWNPVTQVIDALDDAFYAAFGNVEPANKRTMLAIDISGSMTWDTIAGLPGVMPREGSAAMALITARTEPAWEVTAFASNSYSNPGIMETNISPRQRLDDVIRTVNGLPAGGTDCALPMLHALETKKEIDTFIVYTDSETWAGKVHPTQALQRYRDKTGIPAKLICVGMVANEFTIADPSDAGMLDVAGFDTAAPGIMNSFSRGEL